ncbi:uncharacterized protein LOC131246597 isoform X2 [Magnolia sinica]|uniref:uncharacterized protein LOC131246597 isoform X2 n=1 Tax=Magnolia sinica TaxID=86752 RepID=UPI00265A095C|nr:uncharacterized protein LOC131246597 isoform X2 [Magnolia sinica]
MQLGSKGYPPLISSDWALDMNGEAPKAISPIIGPDPEGHASGDDPSKAEALTLREAMPTTAKKLSGQTIIEGGASLCSGNLHPDAVLNRDKCFRANKKAYYAELQKYHTDILENLKKWKDRWSRCKDPEKDIVEKMWRCRLKNAENSHSSHPNESREHDPEENHTATADSCSGVADEQVCISNKERTLDLKGGELQERKASRKHKQGNVSVASGQGKVVINSGKEEKPHKLYVRSGDAAKYMSYFKISRKQHQLVKKIKQSDEGIQSKSLNRVLGDIKSFDVQPYKAFEEEEWKKLHEHWLQLACRDLPAAFTNHSKRQLQRRQWRKSLEQEIADKKIIVTNEDVNGEEKDPETPLKEQGDNSRETEQGPTINTQKCEDHNDSVPHSTHCPPLQRIPSLNRPHDELEPMVLDSEDCNQVILKQEGNAPIPSKFLEKMNPTEDVAKPKASATSAKDVWQGVEIPNSYYHPTSMSHGYKSSSELSPGKQQLVEEQPTRMIDLETNMPKEEPREPLLHGPSDNPRTALHVDNGPPLFCSYANQDHSELLPTFLKGQEMLQSYPEEPTNSLKQSGLQFLTGNNCPSENGQFPGQFQEQQQQRLFEDRQIREKDLYLHQIMQKNMYSNGRYPTQELFSSGDIQEWPADPVRAAPFQPPVNGGMLGHNWFSGDHRARNGWSGTEVSGTTGQCLEGGSSNTDGSLFSVLSQCNKLQAHSQNKSTDSKQHAPARNFVSGGISGNGDIFTFTSNQTSYSSARESSASAAMPWTNLPRSNPGPHDSIEKPFLRSWNK